VCIVGNAELIWDGQQKRVRLRNRLVFPKLLNQAIRFSSVATAEDRACGCVNEADLVLFLIPSSEIGAIKVIDQRKDTATDGDARRASMASNLLALHI
jgi:hypothetical protein